MMSSSKYIEIGSMPIPELARSQVGTVAKYFLSVEPNSRQEASKSIKAACSRYKSLCSITSTSLLIEQGDGSWRPSSVLTVTITERKK